MQLTRRLFLGSLFLPLGVRVQGSRIHEHVICESGIRGSGIRGSGARPYKMDMAIVTKEQGFIWQTIEAEFPGSVVVTFPIWRTSTVTHARVLIPELRYNKLFPLSCPAYAISGDTVKMHYDLRVE